MNGKGSKLGAASPSMFYDYYGFPDEAYAITYPAPGNPDLAERISGLLNHHQIPARIDFQRGFDHGLFIPLKLLKCSLIVPAHFRLPGTVLPGIGFFKRYSLRSG
jgi:4,5-DOPA dioxygenase extradiol